MLVARGSGPALAWPQFLPGGKALLFTSTEPDGNAIEVLTFADHRRKTVGHGGSSAHYIPVSEHEGYLVYTNKATMFAVPFDLNKLETRGTTVPVLNVAEKSQTLIGSMTY